MPHHPVRRRLAALACASSIAVLAGGLCAASASASASAQLPVTYSAAAAITATFNSPATSPPGANNFLLPAYRRPSVPGRPCARHAGEYER